jgi:hypothetical protein
LSNKSACIVEAVPLKKIGKDHAETVREKIHRQQPEIARVGPTARLSGVDSSRPKAGSAARRDGQAMNGLVT